MNKKIWICSVCGYVHHGDAPPEVCPVCGATSDLFEIQKLPPAPAHGNVPAAWRCLNCEYIHRDGNPPEYCPVCAAPAERFEPFVVPAAGLSESRSKQKIVIVGAGIAGVSAAESARQTNPEADIVLISKEQSLPYYRLNLTRYLAGEISSDMLELHPRTWYEQNRIELIEGQELCTIDTASKKLDIRGHGRASYDSLVLTMGSHAFMPPFAGGNRENVFALRTREDADRIISACASGPRCVCIGGGLLGLETAGALALRGLRVTLLEGQGWLLPRQLNRTAGEILEKHAEKAGIALQKNARTKEILGDERVRGVELDNGTILDAELVVIATGVRANSYVARLSGLHTAKAIIVDDSLKTSHAGIFAAGDVAEHRGVSYGTWGPSQFMGSIAGTNAAGGSAGFDGVARSNMLKVLGYDMFSIGDVVPEDASYEMFECHADSSYFCFLFRDNAMAGAILMGDTQRAAKVKKAVENRVDSSKLLGAKIELERVDEFLQSL